MQSKFNEKCLMCVFFITRFAPVSNIMAYEDHGVNMDFFFVHSFLWLVYLDQEWYHNVKHQHAVRANHAPGNEIELEKCAS